MHFEIGLATAVISALSLTKQQLNFDHITWFYPYKHLSGLSKHSRYVSCFFLAEVHVFCFFVLFAVRVSDSPLPLLSLMSCPHPDVCHLCLVSPACCVYLVCVLHCPYASLSRLPVACVPASVPSFASLFPDPISGFWSSTLPSPFCLSHCSCGLLCFLRFIFFLFF